MINYDEYANKYDTRYTSQMCLQEDLSIYNALIDISDLNTKKIVDLGCGTGFLLDLMENKIDISNYLGIDVSAEMIECARKKYPAANFVFGSACKVEEYTKIYAIEPDLAISFFTIPYIGVETIKNVHSVLKSDGEFLAVYYNKPYINPASVYATKKSEYETDVYPKVTECIACAKKLFKIEYMRTLTETETYDIALFKKV